VGKIVPIRFVDRLGNPSLSVAGHPSEAAPVMDAVIRLDSESPPPLRQDNEFPVLALVDTGASISACSAELLAAIGAPQVSPIIMAGATSSIHTMRHYCHLFFPSIAVSLEIDVDAVPLRDQGHLYDLVIGRGVLRVGQLVMDYPNQQFYWELP